MAEHSFEVWAGSPTIQATDASDPGPTFCDGSHSCDSSGSTPELDHDTCELFKFVSEDNFSNVSPNSYTVPSPPMSDPYATQPYMTSIATQNSSTQFMQFEAQDQSPTATQSVPSNRKLHKACQPCATAKRACDGGRPCTRCVRLNRPSDCVAAVVKKKRKLDVDPVKHRANFFAPPFVAKPLSLMPNGPTPSPMTWTPSLADMLSTIPGIDISFTVDNFPPSDCDRLNCSPFALTRYYASRASLGMFVDAGASC